MTPHGRPALSPANCTLPQPSQFSEIKAPGMLAQTRSHCRRLSPYIKWKADEEQLHRAFLLGLDVGALLPIR